MLDLKSTMFEESENSKAPKSVVLNIIVFFVTFFAIYYSESIIPMVLSMPDILISSLGYSMKNPGSATDMDFFMKLSTEIMMQPKYMIASLFSTAIGTVLAIVYCNSIEKRSLSSMGLKKEGSVGKYIRGFFLGIILISAIIFMQVLSGACKMSLNSNFMSGIGLIVLYLIGFLIQGMSEEVIFRGYLMNTLGGRGNPLCAVLVSATAFSLAHTFNPGFTLVALFNLVLFGVFAGLYIIRDGNIGGACAIHSMWNFTQGNLLGVQVSGTQTVSVIQTEQLSQNTLLTGGTFGAEASIFTTIVLTTGILIILFLPQKKAVQ